jgi:hypothetical protein
VSFIYFGLDANIEQNEDLILTRENDGIRDSKSPPTYLFPRLALIGFAAGLLFAMSRGSFSFGFLLGFSIIFTLTFGLFGLAFDTFKHKLYRKKGFIYPFIFLNIASLMLWSVAPNSLNMSFGDILRYIALDPLALSFQALGIWFTFLLFSYIFHLIFIKNHEYRFEGSALMGGLISLSFLLLRFIP